jgi:DNA invertase Pin-like site-specific DNA recombinase
MQLKIDPSFLFKLINQILKEGDLLAVTKLDRCSRNTLSFLQLKNQLAEKGVAFWVLDLPRDYLENSPSSQLISTALAAIAEFEIARITGKSRSTIYKVLKEELGYVSNRLVKNDR